MEWRECRSGSYFRAMPYVTREEGRCYIFFCGRGPSPPNLSGGREASKRWEGSNRRRHQYDPKMQEGWKSYPVRLITSTLSPCCQKPRLLVQSMAGGFVTQNCSECNGHTTINPKEFKQLNIYVSCPNQTCRRQMQAGYLPPPDDPNYGFTCHECQLYIWLADLLPHYTKAV